jgi:hypothetical protein
LRDVYSRILQELAAVVREAQLLGEIDSTEDVAQLTFELDSLMLGANFAIVFFGDPAALERARLAIRQRLSRGALPAPRRGSTAAARRPRGTRKRQPV